MRMRSLIVSLLVWFSSPTIFAGDSLTVAPEQFGLQDLSNYLDLKPTDISFRSDYTEPDSFRLLLVADLMREPLGMIRYSEGLRNAHVPTQPEILAGILFPDLKGEYQATRTGAYKPSVSEMKRAYNLFYTESHLNQLLARAAVYIDVIFPRSSAAMLARLTADQRRFLREEYKELLVTREEEEFFTPEQLDSAEKAEEEYTTQFAGFGMLVDDDPVVAAGIDCLRELLLEIKGLQRAVVSGEASVDEIVQGIGPLPAGTNRETYLGLQSGWKIGGPGNDYYSGDYSFILDFGGDDVYDLSYDPAGPHGVIIIDLGGNDNYDARSDFALA